MISTKITDNITITTVSIPEFNVWETAVIHNRPIISKYTVVSPVYRCKTDEDYQSMHKSWVNKFKNDKYFLFTKEYKNQVKIMRDEAFKNGYYQFPDPEKEIK